MNLAGLIRLSLAMAVISALPAAAARADTLDVPAEYPTIQAAIVAAAPGDLVLVAPGTYVESIDFLGKAIAVESSGGATVTTIDGNGGGSVITFQGGETPSSRLQGFTITGGTGSLWGPIGFQFSVGGGVKIINAGPSLHGCLITANTATDMGGGVFVHHDSPPLDVPMLQDCVIAENTTTGSSMIVGGGGGIAVYPLFSRATLDHCTLIDNATHSSGGGFGLPDRGSLILTDCLIAGNVAGAFGGGGSHSACCAGSHVELVRCSFVDNSARLWGGGLFSSVGSDPPFGASTVSVRECLFMGNSAVEAGGGVSMSADGFSPAQIEDSLIVENSAPTGSGGGIHAGQGVRIIGCTVVRNSASTAGGIYGESSTSTPRQCILWDNEGGQITWIGPDPTYCDIEGAAGGLNIDIDPHFIDPEGGDFHLAPTSACVDAGELGFLPGGVDIDGDPRVLFGLMDIGADETTTPKSPWTFLGHALAGTAGLPWLEGTGELTPGAETTLALGGALPGASSWFIAGGDSDPLPFKGGLLLPVPHWIVGPVLVGPAGTATLTGRWLNGLPMGFVVTVQTWIADPGGPAGFAASNGLAAKSQ